MNKNGKDKTRLEAAQEFMESIRDLTDAETAEILACAKEIKRKRHKENEGVR